MKSNIYYIRARMFPAMLTAIPVVILYYFLLGTKLTELVNYVLALPIILHLTIGCALVYAMTLVNRFLGKEIFQAVFFKNEMDMPTTNYLLYSNTTLGLNMQRMIRQRIQTDFSILLLSEAEVNSNPEEARKQIVFAVSQIRNKTRDNKLLLQHNYEYGFIRNFLGGSIFALIACLVNLYIFKYRIPNPYAFNVSIILAVGYLLFVLCSKWLIHRHARAYARVLFEQYLHT